MTTIVVLALLATVGVLSLFALDVLVRRPEIGIALILGLIVVDTLLPDDLMAMTVAGFQVQLKDAGFSLVALAAALRLVGGGVSGLHAPLLALGALAMVSLLLGVGSGSIQGAVDEFRLYLRFLGSALYASTIRVDAATGRSIMGAWLWAGIAIAGVVALRWMGRVAGVDLGPLDATYDATIRVLSGPETMFVASTAIILLLAGFRGVEPRTKLLRWAGLVLLIFAVVLNRRTVWLALAVALLALLILERRIGKKVAGAAIAGLVLFTLAVPFFSDASSEGDTAQSVTNVGTLLWRVEGWSGLLESGPEEPADYVIGLPFGRGYEREIEGQVKDSNPHSFYVQTFLRTGVVGVLALLVGMLAVLRALLRRSTHPSPLLSPNSFVILVIMQGVWMLAWPPGAEQGAILGLGLAVAATGAAATPNATRRRAVTRELVSG